ncbi:MAG: CAP domain-containing protein, partial [Anaerolineae bacterium]
TGLGRDLPTPPSLPSFPVVTPILPQQEPSPTVDPSPTAIATVEPLPETESALIHTVQAGDTLLGLAKQYSVPMAAIQLQNDLGASTVVQAGQTLEIPAQEPWQKASPFWILYEVGPDETLIGIARSFDLDLDTLQTVNRLGNADRIAVGQHLILPLEGPAAPRQSDAMGPTLATTPPEPSATPWPTATPSPADATTPTSSSYDSDPSADEPLPPAELTNWPRQIAQMINEVRSQHGLPPLSYNRALEQAAQAHANDCARRGWCSHTGSDGADVRARVIRAGYDATGWAECWAQTQTPAKAVEVWMNETPPNDPHRRTLLSDWLTELGLGVSEADWGHYVIADFGRP